MERAKWNGREYTASEVADDFEMEHAIRQISGRDFAQIRNVKLLY